MQNAWIRKALRWITAIDCNAPFSMSIRTSRSRHMRTAHALVRLHVRAVSSALAHFANILFGVVDLNSEMCMIGPNFTSCNMTWKCREPGFVVMWFIIYNRNINTRATCHEKSHLRSYRNSKDPDQHANLYSVTSRKHAYIILNP